MPLELVPGPIHRLDCDGGDDCDCQPVHGTRGREPGPRGCWALKADGTPCGAAARRGGEYCGAHLGATPVAADPGRWAPIGREASAQARARRTTLRAALGITSSHSTRGLLRASVFAERERVVAAALSPLSDPELGSAARAKAALALLDAVEPQARVGVEVELPRTQADVDALGLEELRALVGGDPSPPLPQGHT